MKHVSLLIKPASSLCNLRCRYCFYADVAANRDIPSFGFMTAATRDAVIRNAFAALDDGDEVTFAFQGGEPTLVGLGWFQDFVAEVRRQPARVTVHYALQTNGTRLDDAWAAFLDEHGFLVGLSLDLDRELHNRNRPDPGRRGTWDRVLAAREILDRHAVATNILCVLTEELAGRPAAVWSMLEELNIGFVQFIPCLPDLDAAERGPWALTPASFASFYTAIFARWSADLAAGRYRSIGFFDNLFQLMLDGTVTSCGFTGQCTIQNVIEADGSAYPCDFYVLDPFRLGNLAEQPLPELWRHPHGAAFLRSRRRLPDRCGSCRFRQICRGGCKRMDGVMYVNDEGTFCGYQAFLERNEAGIDAAARQVMALRTGF